MDVRIAQSVLKDMLAVACKVIPKAGVDPIYGGVLLTADGDTLSVSATDSTKSVVSTRRASVGEPGEVILPGIMLNDTVRQMPDELATIRVGDGGCELSCGKARMRPVQLESADVELLRFPRPSCDTEVTIPTGTFRFMVDRACRCVSREQAKPELRGVHVTSGNGMLRMQATDSYCFIDVSTTADIGSIDVIAASLDDIADSIDDDEVRIGAGDGRVFVTSGDIAHASRMLVGNFPDFDYIATGVRCGSSSVVTFDPAELSRAVRHVGGVAKKTGKVSVSVEGQSMVVSAASPMFGEVSYEMGVSVTGGPFSASYAYRVFSDGAAVMSGESFMKTGGSNSPLMMESSDLCSIRYLLLPIRG
jgi:DNA polymerase-3 subunit beta